MIGEVVGARDIAEELARAGVVVALLVVEDLAEADGDVGGRASLRQPYAEGRAVDKSIFAILPWGSRNSRRSGRSRKASASYWAWFTFGTCWTCRTEWGLGVVLALRWQLLLKRRGGCGMSPAWQHGAEERLRDFKSPQEVPLRQRVETLLTPHPGCVQSC